MLKSDRSELDYFALMKRARGLPSSANRQLRVAILADVSTQHLSPLLRALFASNGVEVEIYEAGFDAIKASFGQAAASRPRTASLRSPAPAVAGDRAIDGNGIVVERFGGPEVMHWERLTAPPPGIGEVRLKHSAIGLNYIDVYTRSGYYP